MAPANRIEELHRTSISATACSTICGINPWDSPYSLYQRMVGEAPPREETFPMWLGMQMEGIVIRAFTRETKLKVKRPRLKVDPAFWFITEEYGFPMSCLLDGITIDSTGKAVVEAKTASAFSSGDWENEPPILYWFQAQHQLAVTGWHRAYMPAIVGNRFFYHVIERDDEVIAMLTDKERAFWHEHVVPRVPPAVDGHPATTEIVRARYAHSEPDYAIVIEDPEVERLCQEHRAYTAAIKKMEAEKDGVSNLLLTLLEEAESAVVGDYLVSAKEQSRAGIDVKRLREEQPEVAAEYTIVKSSRPVRVSERKGDT